MHCSYLYIFIFLIISLLWIEQVYELIIDYSIQTRIDTN